MKYLSLTAALLGAITPFAAEADTYIMSSWLPPVHILNEQPYQRFAKDIAEATSGDMTFEVYSSGALIPAASTMQGVRDGVAQIGLLYPAYTPSELPYNNVLNDLAFTSDDSLAAALAYSELGMTNPILRKEWAENGGVFLGGYATPTYNFVCTTAIRSAADVAGLKVRTAGGAQTDWIESLGGVPVSVPIGDVYSGLSRGSLDCTLADATNLDRGGKFWEVASSVTTLPMGVVMGGTYVLNQSFWRGLSETQKRSLLEHFAMGLARTQVTYAESVDAAFQGARDRGLEIIVPSPDLNGALDEFERAFVTRLPQESMANRGVKDPVDLISAFLAAEQSWKDRLSHIDRSDTDAIAQLIHQNIYDHLDLTGFGN